MAFVLFIANEDFSVLFTLFILFWGDVRGKIEGKISLQTNKQKKTKEQLNFLTIFPVFRLTVHSSSNHHEP